MRSTQSDEASSPHVSSLPRGWSRTTNPFPRPPTNVGLRRRAGEGWDGGDAALRLPQLALLRARAASPCYPPSSSAPADECPHSRTGVRCRSLRLRILPPQGGREDFWESAPLRQKRCGRTEGDRRARRESSGGELSGVLLTIGYSPAESSAPPPLSIMAPATKPALARIFCSISPATCGFSLRKALAFSRPWPMRWPL